MTLNVMSMEILSLVDGDCDRDALLTLTDGDGDGYSTCDGECDDSDANINQHDNTWYDGVDRTVTVQMITTKMVMAPRCYGGTDCDDTDPSWKVWIETAMVFYL